MGRTEISPMTRVLLVEDQLTLADALVIAINAQPDLECLGAVASVEEAVPLAVARLPDVVLMDIHLPGADGIEGTRRILAECPEIRVFMLTADATPELFADATAAGAAGFLAKDGPFLDVLAAIRAHPGRRTMVAGGTFAALVAEINRADREPPACEDNWACLTVREKEVLALMGEDLDTTTIAARLGMSRHTAHSHIKRIMTKLRARDRSEALAVAARAGLISGH
jgi:DNA-binding NarL/FixJ family response regulator